MEATRLRSCPWCDFEPASPTYKVIISETRVECPACGALGPPDETTQGAIDQWNFIPKDSKEEIIERSNKLNKLAYEYIKNNPNL